MPPTRGKKKAETITIGFYGPGEIDEKNLTTLMDNALGDDADTVIKFIVPATAETYNDSIGLILDYAGEYKIEYTAVVNDASSKDRTLRGVIKDAESTVDAEVAIGTELVDLLPDDGKLYVLWDEDADNDDVYAAIDHAQANNIVAYDLCNGLTVINLDGDDAPEEEEKPAPRSRKKKDEDEEDEAPAPRRRAKAEPDDDDDDDGDEEPVKRGRGRPRKVLPDHKPVHKSLPTYTEAYKLGIRALRTLARELELAPSPKIGSMDKEAVLGLLYPTSAVPASQDDEDETEEAPAPKRSRRVAAEPTLEEEVAVAHHKAASNGTGSVDTALAMLIRAIAKEVVAALQ